MSSDCLGLSRTNPPASEIIECVRKQAAEISNLRRQLESAERDRAKAATAERRITCARLALRTAKGRLADANKHVDLAAGTYSNHGLRNQMLIQWRGSMQRGINEKLDEVDEYLVGKRNSC